MNAPVGVSKHHLNLSVALKKWLGRHPRYLGMTAQPTLGVKLALVGAFAYPNPSWFFQARDSFQWYGTRE